MPPLPRRPLRSGEEVLFSLALDKKKRSLLACADGINVRQRLSTHASIFYLLISFT